MIHPRPPQATVHTGPRCTLVHGPQLLIKVGSNVQGVIFKFKRPFHNHHHNRESGKRRCAIWPWPRCTALPHWNWMDVPARINGLSYVARALQRGHFQDEDGAPAAGNTYEFERTIAVFHFPSLSLCPNSADRRVLMMSLTRGRPVASVTVVLRTLSCHLMPRIRCWHRMWNACSRFVYADSRVDVSDPWRAMSRMHVW